MPYNSDCSSGALSDSDYDDALRKLDIATCEVMVLSQAVNSDDAVRHSLIYASYLPQSLPYYRRRC